MTYIKTARIYLYNSSYMVVVWDLVLTIVTWNTNAHPKKVFIWTPKDYNLYDLTNNSSGSFREIWHLTKSNNSKVILIY